MDMSLLSAQPVETFSTDLLIASLEARATALEAGLKRQEVLMDALIKHFGFNKKWLDSLAL